MLIVSWNMGCGPRSRYRRTHADAWRYLLELEPDVAFVQEALRISAPSSQGNTFWSADLGTDSGTAVFVRRGLAAEPVTLRSAGSYVAGASVRCPDGPMLVASACRSRRLQEASSDADERVDQSHRRPAVLSWRRPECGTPLGYGLRRTGAYTVLRRSCRCWFS